MKAASAPTPKPRPFSCSLERTAAGPVATINGRRHHVERIDPGEMGTAAAVLHKPDGDSYALLHRRDGTLSRDCPDYVARWEGTPGLCKHLRAAERLALLG